MSTGLDEWLLPEVPAAVAAVWPEAAPTTDQMDHTTAEERYQLVALCECGEWHHFTGGADRFSQLTGESCERCGSSKFVPRSLISERTWNPAAKFKKR